MTWLLHQVVGYWYIHFAEPSPCGIPLYFSLCIVICIYLHLIFHMQVSATQTGGIHFTIQQAKYFAATEARQDGCTGNYRMFDSPFGNFLVPVVPTRAELAQ